MAKSMISFAFPSLRACSNASARIKRFYVVYDVKNSEDPCSYTCIVLNKEDAETTSLTISPHPNTVNPHPVLSRFTSVAVGSNIYMIGGVCHLGLCPDGVFSSLHRHANVRVFNAFRPEDGWKEVAPMHLPRIKPAAVVIKGHIYVFGGLTIQDPEDGEYFDPDTNQWHRFSAPGCRTIFPLIQTQYVDPKSEKSIIIHTDCSEKLFSYPLDTEKLFSYPLDTRRCEILSHEFGNSHRPAAILDHIIYAVLEVDDDYTKVRLHGYDMIQKRWFPIKVPGLDAGHEICYSTAWVIASGSDRLCLIWFHKSLDERKKYIKRIECWELGINKIYSDSTTGSGVMLDLAASIVSKTYFPVEHLGRGVHGRVWAVTLIKNQPTH